MEWGFLQFVVIRGELAKRGTAAPIWHRHLIIPSHRRYQRASESRWGGSAAEMLPCNSEKAACEPGRPDGWGQAAGAETRV